MHSRVWRNKQSSVVFEPRALILIGVCLACASPFVKDTMYDNDEYHFCVTSTLKGSWSIIK